MTVDVAEREVTLPLHPLLSEADVDLICDRVWWAVGEAQHGVDGTAEQALRASA